MSFRELSHLTSWAPLVWTEVKLGGAEVQSAIPIQYSFCQIQEIAPDSPLDPSQSTQCFRSTEGKGKLAVDLKYQQLFVKPKPNFLNEKYVFQQVMTLAIHWILYS